VTRRFVIVGLLGLLFLAVILVSLIAGPAGNLFAAGRELGDAAQVIFWELRVPRTALAAIAGGVLGLSGAVLQGLLRNPLADPGLLGISGAGALGGVGALYFGIAAIAPLAMPLAGLGGAGLAMLVLMALAGRRPPPATLILAGLAVSALVGALTWLALSLAPSPFAVAEALTWIMGTLDASTMQDVWLAAPFAVVSFVLLLPLGRGLDALALGDDTATTLGMRPERLRLMAVLGVAIGSGTVGALVGALAFVGLVVPHALRALVGARPGALLLPSLIGGAVLVLGADIVLRVWLDGLRLQLGVLISLLGAPVFLWLVMRARFAGSRTGMGGGG
jgi:iron complex transport system permease protein